MDKERARRRHDEADLVHQAAAIYVTTVARRRGRTCAVDTVHEEAELGAHAPCAKRGDDALLGRIDALEAAVYGGGGKHGAHAAAPNASDTDAYGTGELIALMAETEAALSDADCRVRRLATVGACVVRLVPALAALERDMDSCVRRMHASRLAMAAAQRRTTATGTGAPPPPPPSASQQEIEAVIRAVHYPALVQCPTDFDNALYRVNWARNAPPGTVRPLVEPPTAAAGARP